MAVIWKICVIVTMALCSQVFAQRKDKTLLGGWRDVNENDEYAQKVLQYAKEEYNKGSKDGSITDFAKIIRLRRQVVSGMKYFIEAEAVVSPCSVNEFTTEDCQNQKTKKQRCRFEVLVVPWKGEWIMNTGYCMN